jgi:hypothetical protein
MEINKLIKDLENLDSQGVKTIKLVFCKNSINVKKLLDEIKLRSNSL